MARVERECRAVEIIMRERVEQDEARKFPRALIMQSLVGDANSFAIFCK